MAGGHDAAKDIRRAPALRLVVDEGSLVGRVAEGDQRAFDALYRLYLPRLRRFLGTMLSSPPMVEEVLDDTMFVVWTRSSSFDGASKVSTWIFSIAYRTGLSALRRRRETQSDDAQDERPSPDQGPEEQLAGKHARRAILRAMDRLSPEHRAVVDLTYFHELGYREIAQIVGCPVETVKTRMHYARRRLRHSMSGRLADWL
ncbi:MAG TPA: sigma-70 family RNA polymerase sigma factor [Caulobacteraceae bacterium]|jgi:RNA polymerase sigma-70 factor (ECF subfamily)|nr:sigma-70 family RNA polymerase sigma factor [Caulobacteraceae bacterium]